MAYRWIQARIHFALVADLAFTLAAGGEKLTDSQHGHLYLLLLAKVSDST
jgi:hypothetical protein